MDYSKVPISNSVVICNRLLLRRSKNDLFPSAKMIVELSKIHLSTHHLLLMMIHDGSTFSKGNRSGKTAV